MKYRSPRLTVDGVILKDGAVLLIKRKNEPFKGEWAIPGGFVEYNEKTEDAAVREVFEETGLKTKVVDLLGVYSDPDRDPRGHTVSIIYLMDVSGGSLCGGDDALDAKFFEISSLPILAFEHKQIVDDVLRRGA